MHDTDLLRLFTIYTCKMGLQNRMIRLMMIVEWNEHIDQALSLLRKNGVYCYGLLTHSGQRTQYTNINKLLKTKENFPKKKEKSKPTIRRPNSNKHDYFRPHFSRE